MLGNSIIRHVVIDEVTMELTLTLVRLRIVANEPSGFYSELTDYWYYDGNK